jgi:hypothetical protein
MTEAQLAMIRKWVLKLLAVGLLLGLLFGLLCGFFVLIMGLMPLTLAALGVLVLVVLDIVVCVLILRWLIYGRSMSPVIYYVLTPAAIIALLLHH